MKRFAKIMSCIALCLSMMVPFTSLSASTNGGDLVITVANSNHPHYLQHDTIKNNADKIKYIYTFKSRSINTSPDFYLMVFSDLPLTYEFKYGEVMLYHNGSLYNTLVVYFLGIDNFTKKHATGVTTNSRVSYGSGIFDTYLDYSYSSVNFVDVDGTEILNVDLGDNGDTPPQPDVPTVPSWMETVIVWNPQWMTVVIGSTICLVALGICLDWLVRRFRRSAR